MEDTPSSSLQPSAPLGTLPHTTLQGTFSTLPTNPITFQAPQLPMMTGETSLSAPIQSAARASAALNSIGVNLDPVPGDPDVVFIRPPFTNFPGSVQAKTGLTYNLMAANPNWFLDVEDFVGPNAHAYPTQLEPPRGWLPAKKKDSKDGWKEGEEPRLRCTLCRRYYSGVNAKSMWRRHVYEKHKIAMSNRRETGERAGGRGARSSNKENKASSSKAVEKEVLAKTGTKLRRIASFDTPPVADQIAQIGATSQLVAAKVTLDKAFDDAHLASGSGDEDQSFTEGPSFSSTPPQTPGTSPSKFGALTLQDSFHISLPPESPYNPLMTPAFRHSPARHPAKQPWRFGSPGDNLAMRDFTLSMLARGESSPNVRGLDVSPIVLVPASERQKRSVFSSPSKSPLYMSPRQLFGEHDSIQSRLDDPGWDYFPEASDEERKEFSARMREFGAPPYMFSEMQEEVPYDQLVPQTPCRLGGPTSPKYTPHTEMFINGFLASPLKGAGSSPVAAADHSSPKADLVSPSLATPPSPLLPAFASTDLSENRPSTPPIDVFKLPPDLSMDIDDAHTVAPALGSPAKLTGMRRSSFTSSADSKYFLHSSPTTLFDPEHSSSSFKVASASTSSSSFARRTGSPVRSTERRRDRSASNASTSVMASGSGSRKTLMDRVLDNKTSRRKHASSSQSRADSEFGVTSMGSPFKLARKTSRQEFMYTLDGDCEMQDAQPRKRRKTVSGRD